MCSATLSSQNVYACLTCGLYFQGRGKQTPAYVHSLECDHHLFISFLDQNVYCLPDNYEVADVSLFDIKYNLNPVFRKEQVASLDKEVIYAKTLEGEDFMPGFVGLNNLKMTDYVNVVLQIFSVISPMRKYLLTYHDDSEIRFNLNGLLAQRIAELIRKMWNPRNFKGHVNPHEVMQAISTASHKMFRIGEQKEPTLLLSWLMNSLDQYLTGKKGMRIMSDLFRGSIVVRTEPLEQKSATVRDGSKSAGAPSEAKRPFWYDSFESLFEIGCCPSTCRTSRYTRKEARACPRSRRRRWWRCSANTMGRRRHMTRRRGRGAFTGLLDSRGTSCSR